MSALNPREPQALAASVSAFVEPLITQLAAHGLMSATSSIDHVCYRVATLERYEKLKAEFAHVADLLSEAYINGRPIATYRLRTPITLASGGSIDVVELPAPKPGVAYAEGFEHIEAVTREPLPEFIQRFPALRFATHNLAAPINRDVTLRLDGGLVKFHEQSLADVIAVEQQALAVRDHARIAIFDFDDTLVASKVPFLRTFHQALERHTGKPHDFADVCAKQRPTYLEFFANLGLARSDIPQVLAHFRDAWPTFATDCHLPTGIVSVLSCLRSEGVDVHVWTARDPWTTHSTLKSLGLSPFIVGVHGYDGLAASKPNPTPELHSLCQRARSVMIGDSNSDRLGASNLGTDFLQAAWIHRNDLAVSTDHICDDPMAALTRTLQLLSKE
jgi:predicted metalloenzyme YecM/phosphoglycolate phosphatase-like HAD superfamily hydrolase